MKPRPTGRCTHIGVALACGHRVVVDVDDVIEHANCGAHGVSQLVDIECAVLDMLGQVHRAQVAHRYLIGLLVLRVISVHRLEECTTPACCCGDRRLQGSLNVIQGCPVSNSMPSILRHKFCALTCLDTV